MNPKVSGDSPKVARNSQSLTFGEARRVFIEELERAVALGSRSQNTLWTYGKRLEFFERETGVELLADVTPQLVERFLIDLQQGRLPDSRKKCSSHYAENHWRHLVGFLGWCRRRGYPVSELLFVIGRNGYRSKFSLSPPVLDEPETKTWAQSDVERILEAARSFPPRDQVAVLLLLKSGVRLQELANLELEDVQGPNLRIRRSKSVRDRKLRVTRWAPLYPDVRKLVEVYIQRYRPASEEPYLLLKEDGSRLTRAGLDSMLDRIHRLAGVRGGAHRYRHSQPILSPVLTPTGWKTIGEIRVGDLVIGADGCPTKVVGVYPQGVQEILRFEFVDGAVAECSPDHLWLVKIRRPGYRSRFRVLPACDIAESGERWCVPVLGGPVDYKAGADLPIDPYTLGALLGDGHFGGQIVLAAVEPEVLDRISRSLPAGHVVSGARGRYALGVGRARRGGKPINALLKGAHKLGLDGTRATTKFIPETYLRASVEARVDLLRGLMDTDGCVYKRGMVEFTTISSALADGMIELVRSLGGVARRRNRLPYATAKHEAIRVSLRLPFNPFYLFAKWARYDSIRQMPLTGRTIGRITNGLPTECVCIEVEHPSGLYVTNDFIVTHNTFGTEFLRKNPGQIEKLREIMGHESFKTLRRYARLRPEDLADPSEDPFARASLSG